MPELPEEMYCSQQICIPPAFPYLLRQYAKAAIRTQPTDLLKWSTAYFRCLALNLPPPVKPRLEYPIPLDYHGITPGWLKALVYQIPNAQTVTFKLLWDRWVGACLKHNTLIEILLLGRFNDNQAIPWYNFIGLCAGHLTENLTHTMIMVCEILTEEPEGGSAMIPLKTFMDIYRFLADIDASKPQHLPNIYFTDSVLGLYEEEEEEKSVVSVISSEEVLLIEEVEVEKEPSLSVKVEEDTSAIVSCPDITAEERPDEPLEKTDFPPKGTEILHDSIDKTFALGQDRDSEQENIGGEDQSQLGDVQKEDETKVEHLDEADEKDDKPAQMEIEITGGAKEPSKDKVPTSPEDLDTIPENKRDSIENAQDGAKSFVGDIDDQTVEEVDDVEKPDSPLSAEDDDSGEFEDSHKKKKKKHGDMKELSEQDGYESVNTIEEDTTGRFQPKERQLLPGREAYPRDGIEMGQDGQETADKQALESKGAMATQDEDADKPSYDLSFSDEDEEYEEKKKDEETVDLPRYEWFNIPVVPGIGPTVPIELVEIVNEYMKKMAKIQHGVVMPRNIRNFACPPLELFDYPEEE